jgi:hypothetical protein
MGLFMRRWLKWINRMNDQRKPKLFHEPMLGHNRKEPVEGGAGHAAQGGVHPEQHDQLHADSLNLGSWLKFENA